MREVERLQQFLPLDRRYDLPPVEHMLQLAGVIWSFGVGSVQPAWGTVFGNVWCWHPQHLSQMARLTGPAHEVQLVLEDICVLAM